MCDGLYLIFTVRCTLVQSAVLRSYFVRLPVCLSVTFRYRNHIGWNSSKIISRPNSLRPLLWLTPTWAIWCTFIRSITTTVTNNFGKSSRGRSQGLPKFFRASIYRAHRATRGHLCDRRAFLLVLVDDLNVDCSVHKYVDDTTLTRLYNDQRTRACNTLFSNYLAALSVKTWS